MSNFAAGRPVEGGPHEKAFSEPLHALFRQSVRVVCGCGWEGVPADFAWHRYMSVAPLHDDSEAWFEADRVHSLMRFVHVVEAPKV